LFRLNVLAYQLDRKIQDVGVRDGIQFKLQGSMFCYYSKMGSPETCISLPQAKLLDIIMEV
jgi:hypothetical protein